MGETLPTPLVLLLAATDDERGQMKESDLVLGSCGPRPNTKDLLNSGQHIAKRKDEDVSHLCVLGRVACSDGALVVRRHLYWNGEAVRKAQLAKHLHCRVGMYLVQNYYE